MAQVRGAPAIAHRRGPLHNAKPLPRSSPPPWAIGAWALLVWGTAGIHAAQAQGTGLTPHREPDMPTSTAAGPLPPETALIDAPAQRLQYTLGLRVKTQHSPDARTGLAVRPVLGLRYGRWRLGHATGDQWLQFSSYRTSTNLAYQLRETDRFDVSLSLRVQNLQDNSSFDGFSSGQNTLRGKVGLNYRLSPRWSIGSDFTQDLMGRGDGTTLSLGAAYGWPLSDRSALSLSGGLNWATASHWATQNRLLPAPAQGWRAGIGSVGVGAGYRYAITPQWAWFGAVGTSRHLGQVKEVSPDDLRWSGQLGFLYFSR